jgi:hypothetical protein
VVEEELPDDLFTELEIDSEAAAGEVAVEVEATVLTDEALAPDLDGLEAPEPLEAVEEEAVEALSEGASQELAALVSAQVDAVVTRIVEEKLPALVERLLAQEIEKIKMIVEPDE